MLWHPQCLDQMRGILRENERLISVIDDYINTYTVNSVWNVIYVSLFYQNSLEACHTIVCGGV